MGGEGSMSNAVVSLKENRALLKKRKFKDIRMFIYESSGKTELEFKKISAEELNVIKIAIRKKAKNELIKEFAIYAISLIASILLIYVIYLFIIN